MKEIKIMGRADFAGDVALWIFTIYIYIYFCVYIYFYYYHHYHSWASLDYPSRVSASGLRSGA